MNYWYEERPVIHEVCNGQGCGGCDEGEIIVRIKREIEPEEDRK